MTDRSTIGDAPTIERAERRHGEAVRAHRDARVAAADLIRQRAVRRTRLLYAALAALLVVLTAAGVVGGLAGSDAAAAERARAARAEVLIAASAAMTTMLTADPTDPEAYLDRVISVSVGDQRSRLTAVRTELAAEISRQAAPSTGRVVDAGSVDDPPVEPDDGATARVLLVAEATNPELVGGDLSARRVTVEVTMVRADGRWLVGQARLP
ncbi:hypothetical protein [Gordonia soli]|uniref:Mce-associated membrane protein n=1 Tax=Gordonia soli NBRC 108243 TaxID=1223545 RepID=M0QHI7_9ACTN|nr:hypothetical protein [Gordonia soli]GAC67776.1 hypothetical protein GS4_11_00440 [Gordonia soli NBRC 108243]